MNMTMEVLLSLRGLPASSPCFAELIGAGVTEQEITKEVAWLGQMGANCMADEKQAALVLLTNRHAANELGGVYLQHMAEDLHAFWLPVGADTWLVLAVCPRKYPTLSVTLRKITRDELVTEIQTNFQGWHIRKCCVPAARTPDGEFVMSEGKVAP